MTDDAVAVLGEAAIPYEPSVPRPGWAEQDPALWEAALAPAIDAALAAAGVPREAVGALGIAGQLDGCVAVDRDGRPLAPCLIWMDRRAEAEVLGIDPEVVRRTSGVVLDAGHMAAKVRWLERHLPDARRAARFHQPVSYLVSRLTGEAVLDHGLASTTMLYSLATRRYDPDLAAAFEVDLARLPAIAEASAPAGPLTTAGARLTGLPAGTVVAVGTGDDFSTPIGAGIVAPGTVACVLGTAEVVGALDTRPRLDPRGLVETHAYPGGGFFVENPGWLSGGAVAWLSRTLGLAGAEEMDRLASAVPAGAGGLTFLPALTGAMAPEWIASARGALYGLTPAHGPGHLARALLEGCAFAMRDVIDRLRELDVPAASVRLLGGGARSALWARIRADLTGLSVEIPARTDTSPVGAAMLAAVARGLAPDLASLAPTVPNVVSTVEPDPAARGPYDEAYAAYRRLFDALRPLFGAAAERP